MKGLFFVAGFLVAVSGCGRNPPESDTSNSNQTLEQRYQARTNLIAAVDGNTAFAMDLYLQIRSTPGNLFLSPYSLSSALAMTYAGARGRTGQQMANTLHFTLPQNRLHAQFGELQKNLNAAQRSHTVQLLVANSLWPAKGLALKRDFLAQMEKNYQARLTPLDYGQTEAARQTINGWVEEQTRQKVKELLKKGVLGPDTVLVLANAIYFKGAWATPFNSEQTLALPFRLSSTKQINVPTMQSANMECGYYAEPEVQVLELPYKGERLSMVILLPTKVDGLAALEQGLTVLKLQGWIGGLRKTDVRVAQAEWQRVGHAVRRQSSNSRYGRYDVARPHQGRPKSCPDSAGFRQSSPGQCSRPAQLCGHSSFRRSVEQPGNCRTRGWTSAGLRARPRPFWTTGQRAWVGVWQYTDGTKPAAEAVFDNVELRTYEVPSVGIERAVRLTWPTTGINCGVEAAPTPNGPWLPVQDCVPPGCQQMTVPQTGPMQFFRAVQAP